MEMVLTAEGTFNSLTAIEAIVCIVHVLDSARVVHAASIPTNVISNGVNSF